MKTVIKLVTIILIAVALGFVGGNIWGDHVREAEPIGFDIGTRLMYQGRGLTVGGISGILIAAAWILRNKTRKK